ncbi:MAG: hypothetical protein WC455_26585 [Dehalococcoidia bacterium]
MKISLIIGIFCTLLYVLFVVLCIVAAWINLGEKKGILDKTANAIAVIMGSIFVGLIIEFIIIQAMRL